MSLVETLALEKLEVNLFRGTTPDDKPGRIFGGQVIAQSLLAAYGTVEAGRLCHSLHCYFLRPGDPTIPIIFEVDRSRDGGSFSVRRVVAIQHGAQIFNFSASFQAMEEGFEHQIPLPEAPPPEDVRDDFALTEEELKAAPPAAKVWLNRTRPIELRTVGGGRLPSLKPEPREAHQQVWFRAKEPIGEDVSLHQVVLAYASDMSLLGTSLRPHAINWLTPGLQTASLDHAMWFHRPSDFNQWHLYVQDSPSASGGRGFNRGSIYDSAGRLVASATQEGLMRVRPPKA
jgi:acyl-CoA thioesterase-2